MPVHGEILGDFESLDRPLLAAAAEVSLNEALLEKLSERVADPFDLNYGDTMTFPWGCKSSVSETVSFKRHESCPEKAT